MDGKEDEVLRKNDEGAVYRNTGRPAMKTPPVVSQSAWDAARQRMLVKGKARMRAGDALAAERRRMPWMAVETAYEFEGPDGKA